MIVEIAVAVAVAAAGAVAGGVGGGGGGLLLNCTTSRVGTPAVPERAIILPVSLDSNLLRT